MPTRPTSLVEYFPHDFIKTILAVAEFNRLGCSITMNYELADILCGSISGTRSLSGIAPSKQESTTYEPSLVCKLLILGCRLLIPDRLLEDDFTISGISWMT